LLRDFLVNIKYWTIFNGVFEKQKSTQNEIKNAGIVANQTSVADTNHTHINRDGCLREIYASLKVTELAALRAQFRERRSSVLKIKKRIVLLVVRSRWGNRKEALIWQGMNAGRTSLTHTAENLAEKLDMKQAQGEQVAVTLSRARSSPGSREIAMLTKLLAKGLARCHNRGGRMGAKWTLTVSPRSWLSARGRVREQVVWNFCVQSYVLR
jgi:hypothetical protein